MKTGIFRNTEVPSGLVFCNLKSSKTELPAAADIPTLVKEETMQALLRNEETPRYLVEAIDFPVKGTGGTYTKRFFQSFLDRMKAHPFGGNKLGHSWPEKNDFYTVGGKIEEHGKDAGTVYFKIYIPTMGYETTNSGFIRDVEASIHHCCRLCNLRCSPVILAECQQVSDTVYPALHTVFPMPAIKSCCG